MLAQSLALLKRGALPCPDDDTGSVSSAGSSSITSATGGSSAQSEADTDHDDEQGDSAPPSHAVPGPIQFASAAGHVQPPPQAKRKRSGALLFTH